MTHYLESRDEITGGHCFHIHASHPLYASAKADVDSGLLPPASKDCEASSRRMDLRYGEIKPSVVVTFEWVKQHLEKRN